MADDPIDAYLNSKTAAPTDTNTRATQDNEMVSRWQAAHANDQFDHDLTQEALKRFRPTINSAIRKYKGPLTGNALNIHAANLAIEALKTHDPSKSAFNTHLTNHLKRLHRVNAQAQGAYVPEEHVRYFGPAQRAQDELVDELGRDPSPEEHEGRLNQILTTEKRYSKLKPVEPGGLANILSLKRRTIAGSGLESPTNTYAGDLQEQNIALLRHDLKPRDQPIYDALYKDKMTSTGAIAKRLGMSSPAVSRAKKRIENAARTPPKPRKRAPIAEPPETPTPPAGGIPPIGTPPTVG